MPKRQLIAAGFSQTMALLLGRLKATPLPTPNGILGLHGAVLNGRIVIWAS
jgi:hypothetical protein